MSSYLESILGRLGLVKECLGYCGLVIIIIILLFPLASFLAVLCFDGAPVFADFPCGLFLRRQRSKVHALRDQLAVAALVRNLAIANDDNAVSIWQELVLVRDENTSLVLDLAHDALLKDVLAHM